MKVRIYYTEQNGSRRIEQYDAIKELRILRDKDIEQPIQIFLPNESEASYFSLDENMTADLVVMSDDEKLLELYSISYTHNRYKILKRI